MSGPCAEPGERRVMPKAMMSGGPIVALVATEEFVMVRRPGCLPFVLRRADWSRCTPETEH